MFSLYRSRNAVRLGLAIAAPLTSGASFAQNPGFRDRRRPAIRRNLDAVPGRRRGAGGGPECQTLSRQPAAIADGERLFDWYNCSGCHFHGGGGMGPALMDQQWIYGGALDQIHASIVQGRPNGMPSWAPENPGRADLGDRRLREVAVCPECRRWHRPGHADIAASAGSRSQ